MENFSPVALVGNWQARVDHSPFLLNAHKDGAIIVFRLYKIEEHPRKATCDAHVAAAWNGQKKEKRKAIPEGRPGYHGTATSKQKEKNEIHNDVGKQGKQEGSNPPIEKPWHKTT